MRSICFICNRYPTAFTPTRQVFVQKLVSEIADLGIDCTVISPFPINQYWSSFHKLPEQTTEITENGSLVKLFFPKYLSFGQKNILGTNTARITTYSFHKAVRKVWNSLSIKPEVIYGHFLTPSGISASRIGKEFNITSIAAFGESSPWSIFNYGLKRIRKEISNLDGIVSVSKANKETLQKLQIFPPDKIKVFPNGIGSKHFYPRNKMSARKKFGFETSKFIVAYVGQFSERKGVLRVSKALDGLDNVLVAYAGKGSLMPNATNCIFAQSINPDQVPEFLSAADVFLLPTLNEGCSNAIIEAMSCGLPIISSNLSFNYDILDHDNAILIDPEDLQEIRRAVTYMKDNTNICLSMGKSSVAKAKKLTLEVRATNIVKWIDQIALEKKS